MTNREINVRTRTAANSYAVTVTSGGLIACGDWVRALSGEQAGQVAVISNATVWPLFGKTVQSSLKRAGFRVSSFLIGDGERHKSLRSLERALEHIETEGLTRDDIVVALGGGVVGDLAGFASAIYRRGIRFLQMPTTLLGMIDASVGGKTGVNTKFGKNMAGAFHQPSGVLIDVSTLSSLPAREMTAGFCEAIKQCAVAGHALLDGTSRYLESYGPVYSSHCEDEIARLVAEHVAFKARIVTGDELESSQRSDSRSRKILNFGHTFAHALEKLTDYRRFRHGEAVGHGILLAGELSKMLEFLPSNELNLLYDVVHRAGKLPAIPRFSPQDIIRAIEFDKKKRGEYVDWVLLKGIGKPMIVSGRDLPSKAVAAAIRKIIK